ncbi:MAG: hypothetical protein M3455_04680, partial [Actinomycetota bacterium]|nr:hypothetical protein [Actinomycetota bacterium]
HFRRQRHGQVQPSRASHDLPVGQPTSQCLDEGIPPLPVPPSQEVGRTAMLRIAMELVRTDEGNEETTHG